MTVSEVGGFREGRVSRTLSQGPPLPPWDTLGRLGLIKQLVLGLTQGAGLLVVGC